MEIGGDEAVPLHPKPRKHSNSAQNTNQVPILPMPTTLPADLITEILLRLPVKPLLRFKCVVKSWLSLISSHEFAKTHLLLSSSNKEYTHHGLMIRFNGVKDCSLGSLLYDSITEASGLDYPGKTHGCYPRIVGSAGGLICLANEFAVGSYDLFLWNPSIRKYKKLPKFKRNVSQIYDEFDIVECQFGFAYEEFQDDYKVVGIFPVNRNGRLSHFEVKIYSLKSDSWRRVDDFQGGGLRHLSGKLVNGKLHWLDRECRIYSIGLVDEKWAEVKHPFYSNGYPWVLGVSGSDLSMLCYYSDSHVDLRIMKEYGVVESWTRMFRIKLSRVDYRFTLMIRPPFFMSNEGEHLLQLGSRFIKYNPKEDSIRYLEITGATPPFSQAAVYVKSLVCPFLPTNRPLRPRQQRLEYGR